jgi:hypothetical protein
VRGVASGVLFMAFFGTMWASIGIGGLQGWGGVWLPGTAVGIGVALLGAGFSLIRASRRLSDVVAETNDERGRRTNIWFVSIFAAEGLLIGVASVICNAMNRLDLFFPIMACIVGIHFFPLAALFRVKLYYLVGTLLCCLAGITLLVVPVSATIAGHQISAQLVVIGFGAAVILWGVGFGLWLLAKRLLASA